MFDPQLLQSLMPLMTLKSTARIGLAQVVHRKMIEPADGLEKLFIFTYALKATDLFESILILRKHGQNESSQALIRALVELNLKFTALLSILSNSDADKDIILDSFRLMRHKSVKEQMENGLIPEDTWKDFEQECAPLFEKYDKKTVNTLKSHGFSKKGLKDLAKEQGKTHWYQILYRNFSRNVHSDDLYEYLMRNFAEDGAFDEYLLIRDDTAVSATHDCFLYFIEVLNEVFQLNLDNELKTYKEKSK